MIVIENEFLRASFTARGAEWRSLVEKARGREYLWQAHPGYWNRTAPVLFPLVGGLKEGRFEYRGKQYSPPGHGFACDMPFRIIEHGSTRVVFALDSDAKTREVFPFDWTLKIEYRLCGRVLHTDYTVTNTGAREMLFSLGAHPGFNVPFFGAGGFEDGILEFELEEPLERWLLKRGLLSDESRLVPQSERRVRTLRQVFAEDALVFKHLKSKRVTLRQSGSAGAVTMDFSGFPYLGIWSPPDAPFICLEPWCGLTDTVDATGKLEEKEGIERLAPGGLFSRSFSVAFEG